MAEFTRTKDEHPLTHDQDVALHALRDALFRCVRVRVPSEQLVDAIYDIARGELCLTIKADDRLAVLV